MGLETVSAGTSSMARVAQQEAAARAVAARTSRVSTAGPDVTLERAEDARAQGIRTAFEAVRDSGGGISLFEGLRDLVTPRTTPPTGDPVDATPRDPGGESSAESDPPQATVTHGADEIILETGPGADQITVRQDADTGELIVDVNGEIHTFTGGETDRLVIRSGAGDDAILVDPEVTANLTLDGGDGNDHIRGGSGNDRIVGGEGHDWIQGGAGHDEIEAGGGNDVVSGGDGRDYINGSTGNDFLYGNAGDDVIYGGDGEDHIGGGDGDDYIDGGTGNDFVSGNQGNDIVAGGRGDDEIWGAEGNDVLIAGGGRDRLYGSSGDDLIYAKTGDAVDDGAGADTTVRVEYDASLGNSITVNGSDEFAERVEADLETLRSLPWGQELFRSMDASGHQLTVEETSGGNAAQGGTGRWRNADGTPGTGSDGTVRYNPSRIMLDADDYGTPGYDAWKARPPLVGFAHELIHGENYMTGTLDPGTTDGVNNRELRAAGLDYDRDGDGVADPNPHDLTENTLREDLNLPPRTEY